jgi:hypothetical protein
MSTFTDPSYAVDRTETFYPYVGIGAYAMVIPSYPSVYSDQATRSDQPTPPPLAAPGWYTVPAYAYYPSFQGGPGLTPPSSPMMTVTPSQPYHGEVSRVYITQIYHRSPASDVAAWIYDKIADLSCYVINLDVPHHRTTGSLLGYAIVGFTDRLAARKAISILHLSRFVGLTVKARFEEDVEADRRAAAVTSYRPARRQTCYHSHAQTHNGDGATAAQPTVPGATPSSVKLDQRSISPDTAPVSDDEEWTSSPVIACGSSGDKAHEK